MNNKPIVGITLGDPAGIGPEIVAKALADEEVCKACVPLVIGTRELMETGMKIGKVSFPINPISVFEDAKFEEGLVDVLDLRNIRLDEISLGVASERAGKAAVEYTLVALNLAMKGKIHAIVSAPVNKTAMRLGGYDFPGQTELLARYTGTKKIAIALKVAGVLIFQYTAHMSLRDALDTITYKGVLGAITFIDASLKEFGFDHPRIGVASVNPHCGENGKFGLEDINEIKPAVKQAQLAGINVEGPIPPDALFVQARDGLYDAVLAMYHDQANIAAKLMGDAVTIVAGLPVIRTSVVHGTAYDIVGKGIANPKMMKKAILTAVKLGARKYKLTS